jgi:hypothetical protein
MAGKNSSRHRDGPTSRDIELTPGQQISRMMRLEERPMGYSSSATAVEEKILAALARIERKLEDTQRRVKAVQQDVNRVKRIVRG